jgi:NAD(P)-dependent dehydrogenase (short-subunit alcohol dehydrogenase family)
MKPLKEQSEEPSMRGKTCLVTGITSGIGKVTARELVRLGALVLGVARDEERGRQAAAEIMASEPEGRLDLLMADMSRLADVRRLIDQVTGRYERLDVLVNNAGVSKARRELTADGLETDFATNHLGPFLLTSGLSELLKNSGPSRIVNVSSDIHKLVKDIPWDNLQGERSYKSFDHYALTKLMNVLFTYELARRLTGSRVTANCLSPGFIRTGLSREATGVFRVFLAVMRPIRASAEKGAVTSLYLATSPDIEGVTGKYYRKSEVAESSPLSRDPVAAGRLWTLSARLCGMEATSEAS